MPDTRANQGWQTTAQEQNLTTTAAAVPNAVFAPTVQGSFLAWYADIQVHVAGTDDDVVFGLRLTRSGTNVDGDVGSSGRNVAVVSGVWKTIGTAEVHEGDTITLLARLTSGSGSRTITTRCNVRHTS